jgi:hypothetical protein
MEFEALKNLVAALCEKAPGRRVILFGSSSLFASFPDADPINIGAAVTIDADFFIEPDDFEIRTELEAQLGEDKDYHIAHGFYADFVDLRLAEAFPEGWRERLVALPGFANVAALHPMDMAVSKDNATARSRVDRRMGRREADRGLKDINTLVTLIRTGHLYAHELSEQVFRLDQAPAYIAECSLVMKEILPLASSPAAP